MRPDLNSTKASCTEVTCTASFGALIASGSAVVISLALFPALSACFLLPQQQLCLGASRRCFQLADRAQLIWLRFPLYFLDLHGNALELKNNHQMVKYPQTNLAQTLALREWYVSVSFSTLFPNDYRSTQDYTTLQYIHVYSMER